jgi:GNAT superfamily N-acetyltransferase
MTLITITPMLGDQLPAVIDLMRAQQERHYRLDPRLRGVRSRLQIAAALTPRLTGGETPLVALDAEGRVRGSACPGVWELAEQSSLHAFLTPRNGIVHDLALPDPSEPGAQAVVAALLSALSEHWQAQRTTGDLFRWPRTDRWIEPLLFAHGFQLDSVCAVRALSPLTRPNVPSGLLIRPARSAEEERLVVLFEEELRAHEPYTPFVRSSPAALSAFRQRLARLFAGECLSDGAPLVLVAEQAGELVAMLHATLVEIVPDEEPGFTPPGLYGCIDNLSVSEIARGRGIGRALVQAAFDAFTATGLSLDGALLWYNPDNPLAQAFWSRLGFVPLWTTYQRRHDDPYCLLSSGMSS